jgi:DNA-binding MarR family transcriptional regulator
MTKKEAFIEMVEEFISNFISPEGLDRSERTTMALEYFEELKSEKPKEKVEITENGAKVLDYMQKNYESCNNTFNAKSIGEGLFVSSRSVSGSMKKLITEGFVEKTNLNPVTYGITEKGKNKDLSDILITE